MMIESELDGRLMMSDDEVVVDDVMLPLLAPEETLLQFMVAVDVVVVSLDVRLELMESSMIHEPSMTY